MSRPRVVVSHWIHPEARAALDEFCDAVVPAQRVVWSGEELASRVRDAEGLIACMADHVDAAFLDRCPALRVVAATLKGYDNFDADACAQRGVWLTIVPEAIIDPTAELAVGLTLGLLRRIGEGDRVMRERAYEGWRPQLYGGTLRDADIGIVGMGALGRAIAGLLRGFGARVRYADPEPLSTDDAAALGVERAPLESLAAESDVLIIALGLHPGTRDLVGGDVVARMSPGALLVNVGRGSTVDEVAVAEALATGRLGGYAADVFATEDWALADGPPAVPSGLLDHPRTLLTPHLGSAVDAVRRRMSLVAVEQVRRALSGETPDYAVNRPR